MTDKTLNRAALRTAFLLAIDQALSAGIQPERNLRGELRCESSIPLGFDRRAVSVTTSKRSSGRVECSGIVGQETDLGTSGFKGFTYAIFQDWSETLTPRGDRSARATAKTVAEFHARGLEALKGHVDKILDQYLVGAATELALEA